ncbi:hypothetical protein SDC9_134073 [bioreactor metagenome]|uniref:Uncharacterized protein n=1 Tax=bioreactor metagenome TaxID=1076179 RepID=A0A645DBX1_9ZZZZ
MHFQIIGLQLLKYLDQGFLHQDDSILIDSPHETDLT